MFNNNFEKKMLQLENSEKASNSKANSLKRLR